ncbi:hypothetical protein D9611_013851 [Ephemerocybe angulata]|uniref:F-box domain-containing protein n=1 Tax=Ephemerocybe angulata TaxID=980116 RepID=A0A8H5BTI5_9AGAR|nr:hypothetical protein D9611_013851 [Tulosesus angulatus]
MPTLPVEIHDVIASHTADDDLKSLGLVSKAFIYPTQRQLFRCIRIFTKAKSCNLASVLKTSPHLAGYIRKFQVGSPLERTTSIVQILVLLQNVRDFVLGPSFQPLETIKFQKFQPPCVVALKEVLRRSTLRSLVIMCCDFPSISALADLLRQASPHLQALSCKNVTLSSTVSTPEEINADGPVLSLSEFKFQDEPYRMCLLPYLFLNTDVVFNDKSSLRTLHFACRFIEHHATLAKILTRIGPSMHELHLREVMSSHPNMQDYPDNQFISFYTCTSLSSLTFDLSKRRTWEQPPFSPISISLASFDPKNNSLQHLYIHLGLLSILKLTHFPYGEVNYPTQYSFPGLSDYHKEQHTRQIDDARTMINVIAKHLQKLLSIEVFISPESPPRRGEIEKAAQRSLTLEKTLRLLSAEVDGGMEGVSISVKAVTG